MYRSSIQTLSAPGIRKDNSEKCTQTQVNVKIVVFYMTKLV